MIVGIVTGTLKKTYKWIEGAGLVLCQSKPFTLSPNFYFTSYPKKFHFSALYILFYLLIVSGVLIDNVVSVYCMVYGVGAGQRVLTNFKGKISSYPTPNPYQNYRI